MAEAVDVATRAVGHSPLDRDAYWVLGLANYRAGKWAESVSAHERSLTMQEDDGGWEWFFMAMSHWQLGHGEKAKQYYTQAVDWLKNQQPQRREAQRFRTEAAEVLGLKTGIAEKPLKP